MKKMSVKFLAVIVIMLVTISGCGKNNESETASEPEIQEEVTAEVEEKDTDEEQNSETEEIVVEDIENEEATYSYWVNFLNIDGSVLQRTQYKKGEIPSYTGAIPTYSDGGYIYTFTGWDKAISAVNGTQKYIAQYNTYAYIINDNNDNVLKPYATFQYEYEEGKYKEVTLTWSDLQISESDTENYAKLCADKGIDNISRALGYRPSLITDTSLNSRLITSGSGDHYIGAFSNSEYLVSIALPEDLEEIGNSTFAGCDALESISIQRNVRTIGTNAFMRCSSLTSVLVNENNPYFKAEGNMLLTKDGSRIIYCFKNKSGAIVIPASVTSIDSSAFMECSDITSIDMTQCGVTEIGERAFEDCDNLVTIKFPSNLTSIGEYAFSYCESLEEADIPASVTSIGEAAFDCCYKLKSVTIPSGLTKIEEFAFKRCEKITAITIPDSVTEICESAFAYCFDLQTVTFGTQGNLKTIGVDAFYNCPSLTTITIPNGVTTIGDQAFHVYQGNDPLLDNITIPTSVTSIGKNAFGGNKSLNTINYLGTMAQWNSISISSNWLKTYDYPYIDYVTPVNIVCTDGTINITNQ